MRKHAILAAAGAALLLTPLGAQAPAKTGAAQAAKTETLVAFYEGAPVRLEMPVAENRRAALQLGPWRFGERGDRGEMKDKHPNLYIVLPGTEYTSRAEPQWDHNLVINTIPTSGDGAQWDVIWAVVIDPTVGGDFKDERELLLAAQQTFRPNDLFDLSDVPGRAVLREYFGIESYRELASLEREGTLPRVILQPAGFSVRAAASEGAGSSQ